MNFGTTAIPGSRLLSQCSWTSIGPASDSQNRCQSASARGRLAGASSYARARLSGAPPLHGPASRSAASRAVWRSCSTAIVPTVATARPTASGSLSVSASNGQNIPRSASSNRSRSATPTGAARMSSTTGTISAMMTEMGSLRPRDTMSEDRPSARDGRPDSVAELATPAHLLVDRSVAGLLRAGVPWPHRPRSAVRGKELGLGRAEGGNSWAGSLSMGTAAERALAKGRVVSGFTSKGPGAGGRGATRYLSGLCPLRQRTR